MLCDIVTIDPARRLSQGVYQSQHWNFGLEFRGSQSYELDYPDLGDDLDSIGVCDSPQQLITLLPALVTTGPGRYAISVVRLDRDDQEPKGGWRWHKWGAYVGSQSPQCEYLADEPLVETVWTYHVYSLGPAAKGSP